MSDQVRVRFAPSPTGLLHIGGLRTALYNYLFTKHHGGTFVLRIEDTDQARYVEGAEADIINSLKWAGLNFDEGPGVEGEFGPYRQSERSDHYMKYAEQLIADDFAYYAFDTQDEIEQMRERLQKSGNPSPKYDSITRQSMRNSLVLPQDEVKRLLDAGEPYVIRLKLPRREEIRFEDTIRGHVKFDAAGLDDQVLIKSDGLPTYHLANVVDDHLMKITHVIRGEEWLSSAPKHIMLYKYLGWEPPVMVHLPLIMSPSGGKLSKRKAETEGIPINVRDYISGDYEPEAVVNFLAYLGWSPGDDREVLSLDDMVKEFSFERVSKGGAVFNYKKLMWYNENYLRDIPDEKLLPRIQKYAELEGFSADKDYLLTVIGLMKDRVSMANEFIALGRYFFEAPTAYDEKTSKKAWKEQTPELMKDYVTEISVLDDNAFDAATLKSKLEEVIGKHEVGFGKLMLPLRLAVTGMGFGPDLFQTMELLGKQEVLDRITTAMQKLG